MLGVIEVALIRAPPPAASSIQSISSLRLPSSVVVSKPFPHCLNSLCENSSSAGTPDQT